MGFAGNPMNSIRTVIHLIAQLRYGAGRCVVDMAVEQARGLKHKVMVCAADDTDEYWRSEPKLVSELESNGVEFHVIGDFFHRRADKIHECAARLRELLREPQGNTVIHAHTAMAAAVGHWAQPDALIATCHGWGSGRPADVDLQDSLALQLCDAVLTYSTPWQDRLMHELAVRDPKKIWMGVNLDRFPRLPEKRSRGSACPKIVTVCELTYRKGVDVLLNAMPAVWEQAPDAELHILGNGDAADDLRHLAAALDPGMKRISFYGAVPDPYSRLGNFDLSVLASRSDNLPISVLETMLARLPVVATSVGGVPELISAAGCGRVVPPESATALAEGIITALKHGQDRLTLMGERGEQFVRERMDVQNTAIELENIYYEALGNRRRFNRAAQHIGSYHH